ncbi:MAG: EamA family transporter, partial [Rhodospirillaceae bacterium]|nr:EamA family transporter [Rhodospirillaceae bacterium]
ASFFSFVNYLNPVFGVLWGALLLAEVISLQAVAALGLILLGVAMSNRK